MMRNASWVSRTSFLGLLLLSTLAAAAEPPTKKGERYCRFRVGDSTAYGVLEEGARVRELKGDLFGEFSRTDRTHALKDVTLLAPTKPAQVFALAGNYRSHIGEKEIPPLFRIPQPFLKPVSCLIADGQTIVIPKDAPGPVDAEGELVIVIGKRASKVSKEDALKYVLGVTCGNDVSDRHWQNDEGDKDVQWWRAKGADTFGPVGPFIASGVDYNNLLLRVRINGEVKQEERTSNMIHGVAETVSFISRYVTLHPGDLIFTGTSGETSALHPGDVVEVELEGVGTLRNPVAAEEANQAAGGAERTHEAIEQLRRALIDWREELGPNGKIAAAAAADLQSRFQSLFREVEPILAARRAPEPTPAPAPAAVENHDQWVKDLRSLGEGSAERRAAAVEALRGAIAGSDPALKLAALRVLAETGDIQFERSPFRPLILPLLETADGETLVAALYALRQTDHQPEDLALVQAAYGRDPGGLAKSISHLLFLHGDGAIEGDSARIVLEVLASPNRDARREALRGLWGAKVTPTLAARLIELADDPETHGDAIYFGLSTLNDKNEAVVDKLIATLADPDWTNNGQRALWGLGHGVPEALQPKVAAALVEMHNARVDPRVRGKCAELVRRYGGAEMEAQLKR